MIAEVVLGWRVLHLLVLGGCTDQAFRQLLVLVSLAIPWTGRW